MGVDRGREANMRAFRSPVWWVTILALISCALLGGASRADVGALLILRPILIVGLAVLLAIGSPSDGNKARALWFLFAAWALSIAVQLVPLPPTVWTALPGRALVAQASAIGGFEQGWRPISLTPDLTWNSLLALVPAAVMLTGMSALTSHHRYAAITILVGLVFLDVLLSILQTSAGPDSPLYLYTVANRGAPTGFFSNRNHNAIFAVAMLPILDLWVQLPSRSRDRRIARNLIAGFLASAIVVLVVISGSRIGLLLLAPCALVIGFSHRQTFRSLPRRLKMAAVSAVIGGVAVLMMLAVVFGRALSIERITQGTAGESRLVNLPTILHIVRDNFPVGSGFGSFDPVFRGYEPDAVLEPTYLNNAHNDLVEVAMTGGLPALLVLIAFFVWYFRRAFAAYFTPAQSSSDLAARSAALTIILILASSLTDYPLRTPFISAVFALSCVLLAAKSPMSKTSVVRLRSNNGADKAGVGPHTAGVGLKKGLQ